MSKLNVNQISPLSGTTIDLNGSVVATAASFSGDVSIGGTLSYDDVTNVDSVGLITAKTGIKVLANGINAVGVITATSFIGDGSALTGITPGGVSSFVASGHIPNGTPVVVNTDGTVGVVTVTTSNIPEVFPSALLTISTTDSTSLTYDSTNKKLVYHYSDATDSSRGKAVVGTVGAGGTISLGAPVQFTNNNVDGAVSVYDFTNNKVVIAYQDASNSDYGTAIVGTVSGDTIEFGSPVVFQSNSIAAYLGIAFDSANGKVVISYSGNELSTTYGNVIVGDTVGAGNTISFGTRVISNANSTTFQSLAYDSTNEKIVISYHDNGNSSYGMAKVGTVSGDSITFGSASTFMNTGAANYIISTYDSTNDKVVIGFAAGQAIVGNVSGDAISFGSTVAYRDNESGGTTYSAISYDSDNDRVMIAYHDNSFDSFGRLSSGSVTGTAITFSSPVGFASCSFNHVSSAYFPPQQKTVFIYQAGSPVTQIETRATSPVTKTTNLTSENYIGIAAETIGDSSTGNINIPTGINTSQTGLTTGRTYYVQIDGTIGTAYDKPSVVAGKSSSSTNLIVR